MDENNVRAEIELNGFKFKLEGPRDYVEPRIDDVTARIFSQTSPIQVNPVILIGEIDTPMLVENSDVSPSSNGNGHFSQNLPLDIDLPSFYIAKAPKSQWQEILVITYFYQKHLGHQFLVNQDYKEAFLSLGEIGKSSPKNTSARLSEILNTEHGDGVKYLYRVGGIDGQYGLTKPGSKFVEEMNSDK